MTFPQSSTQRWRSWRTPPVSVSTSMTATWVPNGKVRAPWSKSHSAASGSDANSTSLRHDSTVSGDPATPSPSPW